MDILKLGILSEGDSVDKVEDKTVYIRKKMVIMPLLP